MDSRAHRTWYTFPEKHEPTAERKTRSNSSRWCSLFRAAKRTRETDRACTLPTLEHDSSNETRTLARFDVARKYLHDPGGANPFGEIRGKMLQEGAGPWTGVRA